MHTDGWFVPSPSATGYRYFSSFIDNATSCTSVYEMKFYDLPSTFENLQWMIATKFDAKIQVLRSDIEDEYMSSTF